MAMIEVTNRCNMSCPVCFSDANHPSCDVPVAEVRRYLEQLLEVTETPIPIQISGGEPTVRKDLAQIVSIAKSLGYDHIELITNGIKISQTPELLHELKHRGLTAVYLQFDGLKKETYLKIRGQDMTDVRGSAIRAVRHAGLCCTLAVAVSRGINDEEIGEIVSFGIDNIDTVRAINFQAAARFTGRFNVDVEGGVYSLGELLKLIETQTGVPAETFRSEHLGHPSCNAMSYIFLVKGKLEPPFWLKASLSLSLITLAGKIWWRSWGRTDVRWFWTFSEAIKIVLTYYPISSVRDIKPPTILFFLPEKTGFFAFQRVCFGGKTTNLYYLENGVIRKRFSDPRVHFALNCAALGCPRLPRSVFTNDRLDEQLDREAREFLAEERNLRVDHKEKTIYISSIFKWYKNDFLNWYRESFPQQEATLLNYVSLYLPVEKSNEIRGLAASYRVRFIPYDWRLNDRTPPT
jgi:organic radical activating enzyme